MNIATTKMSSRGQVVIPEIIRKQLHIKSGSQFVVIGKDDVVVLKSLPETSISDFDSLISMARKQAKKVGLKKADIKDAIANSRKYS